MSASGQARPEQVPSDEAPSDEAPGAVTGPRGPRRWPAVVVAVVLGVVGLLMVSYALAAQQPTPPQPPQAAPGSVSIPAPPATPAGTSARPGASPAVLAPAAPTAITIPAIGVSSPVNQVGLNPDRTIEVPPPGPRYDQAAWYRYSPTPGQLGPSVILGHIDSAKNGPSVFFKLGALRPGQQIQIARDDRSTAAFTVDAVASYPKDAFPTQAVYGDTAALRLITCGGDFNENTRQYDNNTVVFAHLTTPPAPAAAASPVPAPVLAEPTGPTEPTGPATLYGRVVDVPDPARVIVEVQGQRLPVAVLGVNPATPTCATADAVAFARRTLQNQLVTLVPDPTLPPTPARRAYVVLGSQLCYTDAAIRAGWATPGDGLYRPVFDDEQRTAQKARAGMWGPPCNLPNR